MLAAAVTRGTLVNICRQTGLLGLCSHGQPGAPAYPGCTESSAHPPEQLVTLRRPPPPPPPPFPAMVPAPEVFPHKNEGTVGICEGSHLRNRQEHVPSPVRGASDYRPEGRREGGAMVCVCDLTST